jgi:N-methylhydantoinase A
MKQLTIDVGGTFTDCLCLEGTGALHRFKASTTPDDPTRGFFAAVEKAAAHFNQSVPEFLGSVERIVHGTTLGTNALIVRRGAKVGMITTSGFRDVIEMRRGIKSLHGSIFDQFVEPYEPLVPRYLRLPVDERISYTGEILTPLNETQVAEAARALIAEGCDAIAIGFLSAYVNPAHERRAKEIVREIAPDVYTTTSHEILPVWREFERFSTTVISAYIGPIISNYLNKLATSLKNNGFAGSLMMMQANALVQTVEHCIDRAVYLLDSGPAAAPSGALTVVGGKDTTNVLSVDMGGTSFDICMLKNGVIPTTTENWVGEDRVAIKMVDLVTTGAGGGSIAWIDSLGLLRVGPQSAGADPGPAAYGKASNATVTDANLVLGYVPADYFLGGEMSVDVERSRKAIGEIGSKLGMSVEQAALAMWTTINANMANAINEMCTKKGHDLRTFTMVAGGGAGGAHVAGIAKRLSIPKVVIPRVAALMSAYGMYNLDPGLEFARSWFLDRKKVKHSELRRLFDEMREEARGEFVRLGIDASNLSYFPTVEMRYAGQFTDIEVEFPDTEVNEQAIDQLVARFHEKHRQMFTYNLPWLDVELLTFRMRATAPRSRIGRFKVDAGKPSSRTVGRAARKVLFEGGALDAPILDWDALKPGEKVSGPAVIVDKTTSVLVLPDFTCEVDPYHSLVLRPAATRSETTRGEAVMETV